MPTRSPLRHQVVHGHEPADLERGQAEQQDDSPSEASRQYSIEKRPQDRTRNSEQDDEFNSPGVRHGGMLLHDRVRRGLSQEVAQVWAVAASRSAVMPAPYAPSPQPSGRTPGSQDRTVPRLPGTPDRRDHREAAQASRSIAAAVFGGGAVRRPAYLAPMFPFLNPPAAARTSTRVPAARWWQTRVVRARIVVSGGASPGGGGLRAHVLGRLGALEVDVGVDGPPAARHVGEAPRSRTGRATGPSEVRTHRRISGSPGWVGGCPRGALVAYQWIGSHQADHHGWMSVLTWAYLQRRTVAIRGDTPVIASGRGRADSLGDTDHGRR